MLPSLLARFGVRPSRRRLVLLFFLLAASAQAQGPSDGGPAPGGAPAIETPLDGGASALLATGVAYGLRRLCRKHAQG